MPQITIKARRLITESGSVEFPVITVDADLGIVEIASDPKALANETDTLTPAFFDIHTHGAMGEDVMHASRTGLVQMQMFLARHGVAHYLPTTVTASIDETLHALESLANAIESDTHPGEATPIGIHLEGPFLSHLKRGVHPAAKLQRPSIDLFDRFQNAARGHIVLMTIAPELPGAIDLIRYAASHGVRLSLGHSNATATETLCGIEAGATSATHTFNAMRALDHREPGIAGIVLDDDRLFAEIICDGIHVDPAMVDLWIRAKGPERAILVTDAISATGRPDGNYTLAGLPVTVASGRAVLSENHDTLAGSVLTMDRAVSSFQRFTRSSLAVATRLASSTPAAMLGFPDVARVAVGLPLCLNRFNSADRLVNSAIPGRKVQ